MGEPMKMASSSFFTQHAVDVGRCAGMKTQRTMRSRARFLFGGGSISVILLAWLGACQSSPAPSEDDDDGGGSATGAPATGWTPEQRCRRMLDCLSVTDPVQASEVLPTFGAPGTCWASDQDGATCATICEQRLEELHEKHWHEPACVQCVTDADCGEARICASGACIERCEDSLDGCCEALCVASHDLGCEQSVPCSAGCPTLEAFEPACGDAWAALYRCQALALPDSVMCSENTVPPILAARCDVCAAEQAAIPVACGVEWGEYCE